MRVLEIVHIEWIDSEAINGWTETKDVDPLSTLHCVGMLIHQDDKIYTIASAYDPGTDMINAAISIPSSCVTHVDVIATIDLEAERG